MLVILDRDGVVNAYEEGEYICRPEDWVPLKGSIQAIADLSRAGYQVAIATNQSGIARGYYTAEVLELMHERLQALVSAAGGRISHIAVCPHHPDEHCLCRKPQPGLLREIGDALGFSQLDNTWMVGDSRKDLEAAIAAGCRPVLVRTGGGRSTEVGLKEAPLAGQPAQGVEVTDDLASFVSRLLAPA